MLFMMMGLLGGCTYITSVYYEKSSNMHVSEQMIHKQHKSDIYRKELSFYRLKEQRNEQKYLNSKYTYWLNSHVKASYYRANIIYSHHKLKRLHQYIRKNGNKRLIRKKIIAIQNMS